MNERESCGDCGGVTFHLDPDGRIICANDGCVAEFGTWIAGDQPGIVISVPTRLGRRR